ncbi:polyphosphate kinase 1 [Conexibacter sp. DBS9H8]|uniref:polyphosphate kinase 1 n=1 Tax=Conexibacter sp. DBS9H8 TaxID=2937801 RepID=UPI00200CEFF5|nr:polyphosphate kinase 1 [Conexibacter sp. DBS9H8]
MSASAHPHPARERLDPSLYLNRELSWLDFNERVLELAEDTRLPLLERAKFLAIHTANLDEFFMIRVAGVQEHIAARTMHSGADGIPPTKLMGRIAAKVREQDARHARVFAEEIRPALGAHGLAIVDVDDPRVDPDVVATRFREQIFPVLTPLAIGHGRPFPYISNLSLSLIVHLHDPELDADVYARVKVPKEVVERFVAVDVDVFIPLEQIIARHLDALFPGMAVIAHSLFRVTRDADFEISDEADDLVSAVENELRRRRFGEVIRLEVAAGIEPEMLGQLMEWLDLHANQVYETTGLLDPSDLFGIVGVEGHDELRHAPWTPLTHPAFRPHAEEADGPADVLAAMRNADVLVHYPYHSFATSVEQFVTQAVDDPNVLAIKMTVYRTSDDSALVPALIAAAERGKQAVCMVELKARFDERRNIRWSRKLEEVGAHVVHGIPGLKTHAKLILVVRRERDRVRHYVMIGTGNFHAKNAKLYEDFGLFTTDPEIGAEVAGLFNALTGYAHPSRQHKVLVAPDAMRVPLLECIEQATAAHRAGEPALIRMKMNSLVDRACIDALYRASQAGVTVELNLRGICCLRPGVPGVSENIHVVSVVGRFLEHSRIFSFRAGVTHTVYIGSADLMPRNLDRRVELLTPVEAAPLVADLEDTLDRCFADDTDSWELDADGHWERRHGCTRSVHRELMERTAAQASAGAALGSPAA